MQNAGNIVLSLASTLQETGCLLKQLKQANRPPGKIQISNEIWTNNALNSFNASVFKCTCNKNNSFSVNQSLSPLKNYP